MNILLIEDEDRIADFLVRGLKAEGHSVTHAGDGETGLSFLGKDRFDAVLLDVMLPGISGHEVCAKMRFRKDFTPVMMLTALDQTDEKVAGLQKGADDYLAKPFDFDELLARLDAMTRRRQLYVETDTATAATDEGLEVDTAGQCIRIGAAVIDLSGKELDLMALLVNNSGRVMSRERILNAVWGANSDPLTNTVDVHIGRLRKKLGPHAGMIATVHGTGYRLTVGSQDAGG